jgi:hypothetical protein
MAKMALLEPTRTFARLLPQMPRALYDIACIVNAPNAVHAPMRRLPVVPICRIPTGIAQHPKSERSSMHPVPTRGALRGRHGRWGGMRWTRELRKTNASVTRTVKSCGSGAPTLALRSWSALARFGSDGGKRARSPGRARRTPLNHCAGNAGCCGVPVVADACAFCCTGGYGCNAHPAFPAPSLFVRVVLRASLGRNAPREQKRMFCTQIATTTVIARSAATRQSRGRGKTACVAPGLLRFARNDDGGASKSGDGDRDCLRITSENRDSRLKRLLGPPWRWRSPAIVAT